MTAPNQLPLPLLEIAERARREVDLLTREIGEIELLVQQERAEASRHEQKRAQLSDRLNQLPGREARGEAAEEVARVRSPEAQSSGIRIQPCRIAYTTAWVRSFTLSLRRMLDMWFLTVCSLIDSA